MAKPVRSVKNSLKFKAGVKRNALSVRIGTKKYVLPMSARVLSGGEYLFLSFSASSELYRVNSKALTAMKPEEDAADAFVALNPGRKKTGRKRASTLEVPSALSEALKKVPQGYKLGYDSSGAPKLVKKRTRHRKS